MKKCWVENAGQKQITLYTEDIVNIIVACVSNDIGITFRIRIRNGLMEKQQTCTQHNTA